MPTVYRKTAKGQAEIATRTHHLPPRLRQALILVDGKRSDDELRRMLPQGDEALRALIDDGFVEPVGVTAVPVAAAGAPAAASAAAPKPQAPLPAFGDQLKREIVRSLNDLLGPMAEGLALKVERARNPDELRKIVEQAHRVIRDMRGAFQATAFADRFLSSETT
ncbi:hypothetical protein [Azohydromonas sediminis]|uniref:hypothetical protein n=1 Tax=Azohydromonas sediminis TaxID=2259674 RepID=UPI000E656AC7|nr:hypothetical protein [Azohydromonas sediminis]